MGAANDPINHSRAIADFVQDIFYLGGRWVQFGCRELGKSIGVSCDCVCVEVYSSGDVEARSGGSKRTSAAAAKQSDYFRGSSGWN